MITHHFAVAVAIAVVVHLSFSFIVVVVVVVVVVFNENKNNDNAQLNERNFALLFESNEYTTPGLDRKKISSMV